MIDTHCHLDLAIFDGDRTDVLARARAASVDGMLIPAIRPSTWAALAALPANHPGAGIAIALGVHPQVVLELTADERRTCGDLTDALTRAIADSPSVVAAVGECGLDGATADRELQETILRAHVRAARALQLPLVVHVLRAHDTAPRILREERAHEVGGVMHSYSGGADLVAIYRDLGFAFSFAGPVTYPGSRRPVAAAAVIPADLLLAETDAPDQAPDPHRGQRSEPAHVARVIDGLAAARGANSQDIAALTTANALRVFAAAAEVWSNAPRDGTEGAR